MDEGGECLGEVAVKKTAPESALTGSRFYQEQATASSPQSYEA
jgi:hypothetical protein